MHFKTVLIAILLLVNIPGTVGADNTTATVSSESTTTTTTTTATKAPATTSEPPPRSTVKQFRPIPDPRSKFPVVVQEAAKWIPELEKILAGSSSPNATQLKEIYEFIQSIKQLKKTPKSILGLLEEVEKDDLFDVMKTTPSLNTTQMPSTPSPFTSSWDRCREEVKTLWNALSSQELWALKMVDASGKPGHSILQGNRRFIGNHKECYETQSPLRGNNSRVEGNICRLSFNMLFASNGKPFADAPIVWDLCLPKSCKETDLGFVANQTLGAISQFSNIDVICTADLELSDDAGAIVAILILTIIAILLLGGTLTEAVLALMQDDDEGYVIDGYEMNTTALAIINDGFEHHETSFSEGEHVFPNTNGSAPAVPVQGFRETARGRIKTNPMYMPGESFNSSDKGSVSEFSPGGIEEKDEVDDSKDSTASLPSWQRVLLAFSISRNVTKMMSVTTTSESMGCLHGIRVLSMAWIILGHTYISPLGGVRNPSANYELLSTWRGQIIYNGTFAIDTFFLISGLLTAYIFLKKCGKAREITLKTGVMYYVHRFWRLTSSYMLWVMVVATLVQYVGKGRPAWKDYAGAQVCRDNWWTNLLYINNLYRNDEQCLPVTWFLASDMQFHIFAPLALVPWILGSKAIGFVVTGLMIALHITSNFWLQITIDGGDIIRNSSQYLTDIFVQPYTRVAPYAMGLMLGWALWKTKCKLYINKYVVVVMWIVSLCLILILTLVTYDENTENAEDDPWTHSGRSLFETMSRPLWTLAVGWIVLACTSGYGGFINSLLAWGGWQPLSRLTYCVYLVHGTIIMFEEWFVDSAMYFSETVMVYRFLGFFLMSYLVGLLLSLVAESPLVALEKIIFPWD